MKRNLLLISNSTNSGEPYLGWPKHLLKEFYKDSGEILFIPYAGVNLAGPNLVDSFNAYEKRVAQVFEELGLKIKSIHHYENPVQAVMEAEAVAVGGGNTFHLVYMMHKLGIMGPIRKRIMDGMLYAGWSAGSNVACPSLRTTNDMPIIEPESFNCLNVVPFQINPHYLDAHPEGHGGETRQQRIEEFTEVNREMVVVGLREACALRVIGDDMTLIGPKPLRYFKYGTEAHDLELDADLKFLLEEPVV